MIPSFDQPLVGPPSRIYRLRASRGGNTLVDTWNRFSGKWSWLGYRRTWRAGMEVQSRMGIAAVLDAPTAGALH